MDALLPQQPATWRGTRQAGMRPRIPHRIRDASSDTRTGTRPARRDQGKCSRPGGDGRSGVQGEGCGAAVWLGRRPANPQRANLCSGSPVHPGVPAGEGRKLLRRGRHGSPPPPNAQCVPPRRHPVARPVRAARTAPREGDCPQAQLRASSAADGHLGGGTRIHAQRATYAHVVSGKPPHSGQLYHVDVTARCVWESRGRRHPRR
jgi:hypothetical protein